LTLDEPALKVRIASDTLGSRLCARTLAGACELRRNRTGSNAGTFTVGTTGQNDRNPCSENYAGVIGPAKEGKLLRLHIACLEIGHNEDVGLAGDGRNDTFSRAAAGLTALSKARGPSSRPPEISPRSAILQSAAASIVERSLGLTISTAARIAIRGDLMPMTWAKSMAF
jgi:hypothetical protein